MTIKAKGESNSIMAEKRKSNFEDFEKKIKINFNDQKLLLQALVHRSYLNENPGFEVGHNERLEFLGDAVIELVVTEYLYKNYSNPEGELTNWRASLVNSQSLSELASELGVEKYLKMSKGESKDKNGKARQSIMANALEAIVGATYLDQGLEVAREFIEKNLITKLPFIISNNLYLDAKSNFQEEAQDRLGITPLYKVIEEHGPDHNKHFVIGVYLEEELVAKGEGFSKQEAEMEAAKKALKIKEWD